MIGLGSIIIVRNLIFENNESNKKYLDHAFFHGRPCIVLHFDEEYIYFVPLSRVCSSANLETHFIIDMKDSRWDRKKYHSGMVNLEKIFKQKFCWKEEIGVLDPILLFQLLSNYIMIHTDEYYDIFLYYLNELFELEYDDLTQEEKYDVLSVFNEKLHNLYHPSKQLTKKYPCFLEKEITNLDN